MTTQDTTSEPTHVAYADETHYNTGRYRGLALVTLTQDNAGHVSAELRELLQESGVTEFKWKKLDSAKDRFAALKMLDHAVNKAIEGLLRVDALSWDTEDSRHKLIGRADIANLHRMYYRLFHNVLRERWPDGSVWRLCPHQQTAVEWDRIEDFLDMASTQREVRQSLFTQRRFSVRLKEEFRIEQIAPCESYQEPLVQLADLFAGLAVYSRSSYGRYQQWQRTRSRQLTLFQGEREGSVRLSLSDRERCQVLGEFDARCKRHKLGVSLETNRGLRTFNPMNPINFWWYEPQHERDKAPVRRK